MDRFSTLSAVIASLLAVALASPAGAVEKCKAKVDKKTGAIGYYFKYGGEGSVGFAYSNLGPPSTHTEDQEVFPFANEEACQQKGSGKACQVSSIPDVAAIAPTNCKAYLYDESDDTVCEVRVPRCQPALRPLPTSGYYCIENNHETTAVWDAATGHAWHISSDHQPRSLDDHHEHLLHLNGDHVDPADTEHTPLVHPGDLELPTLHQLKLLAGDCAALFNALGGVGGTPSSEQECLHTLCTELWPDPASTDNCAWSATRDATQPETHGHAVCLNAATPPGTPAGAQGNRPDEIHDGELAAEVVNLTKFQILSASGVSPLAQANQSSQSVISLLGEQ